VCKRCLIRCLFLPKTSHRDRPMSSFFLSFRPEGSDTKRFIASYDADIILPSGQKSCKYHCKYCTCSLHPQIRTAFILSLCSHGYQQRRRKLNHYLNCVSRRSFSKEAESSHHRQSSEMELRSFWVDRTKLINFVHASFSSSVSCLPYRCLLGHAVGSDRFRSNVAFNR